MNINLISSISNKTIVARSVELGPSDITTVTFGLEHIIDRLFGVDPLKYTLKNVNYIVLFVLYDISANCIINLLQIMNCIKSEN